MATSTGGKRERKRKRAPRVNVRRRGKISITLEMLASEFEEKNPGLKTRWVYSPEHKPELANVISRKAQGYRTVVGSDHPEAQDLLNLDDDQPVRNGDLILMAIPKEEHRMLEAELREIAEAEKDRINHEFYENVEAITTKDMRPEHKPRPRGRAVIEERDFEFDIEQTSAEE